MLRKSMSLVFLILSSGRQLQKSTDNDVAWHDQQCCLTYPRLDIFFLPLGAVDPEILLRSLNSWKTPLKYLKAFFRYIKLIVGTTIKKIGEGKAE